MQSKLTRTSRGFGALVLCAALASCVDKPTDSAGPTMASVQFALKADAATASCPVSLNYPDIKSVRLRLYEGSVDDPDTVTPLFDTSDRAIANDGCLSFVQCADANVQMDASAGGTFEERAERCTSEGGSLVPATVIHVTNVSPSQNATAWLEAFADADCTERAFVGLRGGIPIQEDAPRSVHLAPLCQGHFTALPHPEQDSPAFTRDVALTPCGTDCDCIDAFKQELGLECSPDQRAQTSIAGAPLRCVEGRCSREYAFEDLLTTECTADSDCTALYPYATCGEAGYCDTSTYYPLNALTPRAFHSATAMPSGRIALVGGLTAHEEDTFISGDPPVIAFNPRTFLFESIELSPYDIDEVPADALGRAFHAAAVSSGESSAVLALSGGLKVLDITIDDSDGVRKLFLSPATTGPEGGDSANVLDDVLLIGDSVTQQAQASLYPLTVSVDGDEQVSQPVAMQTVDKVLNNGVSEFLFVGGITPADSPAALSNAAGSGIVSGNLVTNCVYAAPAQANCLVNPNVFTGSRAAAVPTCFERLEDGTCSSFAVVGGANATSAPIGEVFQVDEESEGATGSFVELLSDEPDHPLRRSKFSKSAGTNDGNVFTFGGTDVAYFDGPANVPTYKVSLDATDPEAPRLVTEEVDSSALPGGQESAYRTHHTVTETESGEALIVGGLDRNNRSTSSVLVFDFETSSYTDDELELTHPRFGHSATRIESGPLKGAILITGGLYFSGEELIPELVDYAEIYVP